MTTENTIYPGLNDAHVEFFNMGEHTKAFSQGKIHDFYDLPFSVLLLLREALKIENDTDTILCEWHPESEMKRLEKFVRCRFGGLDFTPDVQNLTLGKGDYWACPLRGVCKGEGVVCRNLEYNSHVISSKEITAMRLLSTSITNEVLADKLKMAMGTLHLFKNELYKKLNVQTKQEVVVIAASLNLL